MTVILPQFKLFYAAVPKVACTSIKHMFFEAENGRPFEMYKANGQVKHIHNAAYTTTLRKWFPDQRIRDFTRLTVVRDPVRRFLSAYGNRVVAHKELSEAKAGAKLKELKLAPDPDLDTFVDNLERYIKAHASIQHHTAPMVDFLGDDPAYFTRVYAMDELDRFMADVNAQMGTDLTLQRMQTGGPKLKPDVLSKAQVAKLERFYRADYAAYGRYF